MKRRGLGIGDRGSGIKTAVCNLCVNFIRIAFKQKPPIPDPRFLIPIFLLFLLASCTFDYGESDSSGDNIPNLIMENVDYVRVISADPLARVKAERVERYEKQSLMKLENLSFEQYGERGEEVNVFGRAGFAQIETDTGNIFMDKGVMLDVETEDIVLETNQLEWEDETKTLSSGYYDEVYIYRENGTRFSGRGLHVDARKHEWEFTGSVRGTYISDD